MPWWSIFYCLFNTDSFCILRVIYTGAFLSRKYNWVIGLFLLFFSIFTGYTGYLLPMDQLAFWATQTGAELIKILPFGDYIYNMLIPDGIGGRLTLIRFYILHIIIMPISIIILSFIHFFRVCQPKIKYFCGYIIFFARTKKLFDNVCLIFDKSGCQC